jgi:hypothetical protein
MDKIAIDSEPEPGIAFILTIPLYNRLIPCHI